VDRGSAHRGCSHCTEEHPTFNRRNPRESRPDPFTTAACAPRGPSSAMAKEGVEKAEETEQMIEKETSKEPAEGGDGSHRLGDAQEMRAVVLAGFGGLNKLRLSRKAMPEPQDGELKIRVKAWSSIHDFLVFLSFRAGRTGSGWESLDWGCCPRYPAPTVSEHPLCIHTWLSEPPG
jgi:hypothetical protein